MQRKILQQLIDEHTTFAADINKRLLAAHAAAEEIMTDLALIRQETGLVKTLRPKELASLYAD